MPWKTNSEEEQRWGFVQLALRAKLGLAELCRRSGISRKTAYKWIARFQERGRTGLRDRIRSARRPHNRPSSEMAGPASAQQRPTFVLGSAENPLGTKRHFGRLGSLRSGDQPLAQTAGGERAAGPRMCPQGPAVVRAHLTIARGPMRFGPWISRAGFAPVMAPRWSPLTVRDLASRYILDFCLLRQQTVAGIRWVMAKTFYGLGCPKSSGSIMGLHSGLSGPWG